MKNSIFKLYLTLFLALNLYANNNENVTPNPTSTEKKEAYIKLLTNKYATQTKGLIPQFKGEGYELIKHIPNTNLAVLMLPYSSSNDRHDSFYSLVLAVIDTKHERIVQSYFHKNIAQSDAIYVSNIVLDTTTFHDISKNPTFTISIEHTGVSVVNPFESSTLYIYSLKDKKISLILNAFEVLNRGGENDDQGKGYTIIKTVNYSTHKISKEYDTLIFDSSSKKIDFDYSNQKNEKKTSDEVHEQIQLEYKDGMYENLNSEIAQQTIKKDFLIAKSTKSFNEAVKFAEKLAQTMNIKNISNVKYNKETGLTYSQKVCKENGFSHPCYVPRGRFDDGVYISIEYSSDYTGFTKGYYMVMVASGSFSNTILKQVQKFEPSAYIKSAKVYMGCIH